MRTNKVLAIALAIILVAATLPAMLPASAATTTITYTADFSGVFSNPERGFYARREIISLPQYNPYAEGGDSPDFTEWVDWNFTSAKARGNTIIHSYLHLDKFTGTDVLPQGFLDNLSDAFAAMRNNGLKSILRPAYTWSVSPSVSMDRTLKHIAQINAVVSANADVVMCLEGGYLGQWGEWHAGPYTDSTSLSDANQRYKFIKTLLDTTPPEMPICIRYPLYIKEFFYMNEHNMMPLGFTKATQEQLDRIGFHNDSFIADADDCGTYQEAISWFVSPPPSVATRRQWMYDLKKSNRTYTLFGGETQERNTNGWDDAAGVRVQSEMSALRCTYINEDYAANHINIWKAANLAANGTDPAETAYTRVKRKMGYRIRLQDATFTNAVKAGGGLEISANLYNDGYSSLVKERPIFVVFSNSTITRAVQLKGVDVREWLTGANAMPTQAITVPSDLPMGEYNLSLWLPDLAQNLRDKPAYSVRFANAGIWDAQNGYNKLGTVTVGSTGPDAPVTTQPTTTSTTTAPPQPGNTWPSVESGKWINKYNSATDALITDFSGNGIIPSSSYSAFGGSISDGILSVKEWNTSTCTLSPAAGSGYEYLVIVVRTGGDTLGNLSMTGLGWDGLTTIVGRATG
ncbi:MAG: DUF4832 domain-containing protein, partial [Oscillospiraceae bacterium]|nr:DUF4832 domain-containing protein [Oscillospiraceae bacterium]